MKIGELIRSQREGKRITKYMLCKEAKITLQQLKDIESGTDLRFKTLCKIFNSLGITLFVQAGHSRITLNEVKPKKDLFKTMSRADRKKVGDYIRVVRKETGEVYEEKTN